MEAPHQFMKYVLYFCFGTNVYDHCWDSLVLVHHLGMRALTCKSGGLSASPDSVSPSLSWLPFLPSLTKGGACVWAFCIQSMEWRSAYKSLKCHLATLWNLKIKSLVLNISYLWETVQLTLDILRGFVPGPSLNTKIWGCSSPLNKMEWYFHNPQAHPLYTVNHPQVIYNNLI